MTIRWRVTGRSRRLNVRPTTHVNGGSWPDWDICYQMPTSVDGSYPPFVLKGLWITPGGLAQASDAPRFSSADSHRSASLRRRYLPKPPTGHFYLASTRTFQSGLDTHTQRLVQPDPVEKKADRVRVGQGFWLFRGPCQNLRGPHYAALRRDWSQQKLSRCMRWARDRQLLLPLIIVGRHAALAAVAGAGGHILHNLILIFEHVYPLPLCDADLYHVRRDRVHAAAMRTPNPASGDGGAHPCAAPSWHRRAPCDRARSAGDLPKTTPSLRT